MKKTIVRTEAAPRALGPYSQGVAAGGWLFISGQLGLDPATGELAAGGAAAQAEQAMRNIRAVLEAAGAGVGDLVRLSVHVTDLASFAQVNEVMGRHLADAPPARATAEVRALPKGAAVMIEAQAWLGS